ncbi:hypothetical protein [Burkholderia pseudomallei]|uniref:hypothetical protein n=1 Tax=Burkholderia pseudomallei TaxID=28450 RepID=UPI002180D2FF|nr:hypothetical protein [Burkholderia pseudomallei]
MTPGARAMCVPAGARAREGGSRAVDPPACARAPLAGAAWGTVSGGGPSVTSDAAIAIEACANATTSKPRAYAASATRAIVAIAGRVARPEARPCIRHDPHLHSRERLARLPLEQCASRPLAARRRAQHGDPLAGARACVGERRVRAHGRLRVCGERIDARPERRAGEHHGMASRASATSTAEVRGARLGQRAGAGRGRALGGGEQIGAHRVRERARRNAGRGARLLEERHVAGGGAQAGDHGGPRSTNGQRGSKRPRAPAPEANARGDRTAVRCAAGND